RQKRGAVKAEVQKAVGPLLESCPRRAVLRRSGLGGKHDGLRRQVRVDPRQGQQRRVAEASVVGQVCDLSRVQVQVPGGGQAGYVLNAVLDGGESIKLRGRENAVVTRQPFVVRDFKMRDA